MGCKAEGAAQGYTVLGSIILFLFALQMISSGLNGVLGGDFNSVIDVVLGITLVLMAVLALDACGFIYWKVQRSGLLLAIFGLVSIFIIGRGLNFDILSWLTNIGMLAGLMFLIAGILLITKS